MANDVSFLDKSYEPVEIATPCLICGEPIPSLGHYYAPKVCEKCKAAVMKVREQDGK